MISSSTYNFWVDLLFEDLRRVNLKTQLSLHYAGGICHQKRNFSKTPAGPDKFENAG